MRYVEAFAAILIGTVALVFLFFLFVITFFILTVATVMR